MNNEKAREYFSAYSEGTLDAGLAQSFEAKLKADEKLRTEYEQFEETLKELESLRFENIEAPFDLNERISAAIDKSLYDRKRSATPNWTTWLRNVAFAGLAAAALFGAYYTLNMRGDFPVTPAGPGSFNSTKPTVEQIQYGTSKNGVQMSYRPNEKHVVTIKGGSNGEETFEVDGRGWLNELKNTQPNSAAFTIDVRGEVPSTIVVVPGMTRNAATEGQGNLVDFAKAIADHFGKPVVLRSTNVTAELSWNFGGGPALQEASAALSGMPFSADLRESGVLSISDH